MISEASICSVAPVLDEIEQVARQGPARQHWSCARYLLASYRAV
jgi:hypothetical protein